jgi:hypothetical protein
VALLSCYQGIRTLTGRREAAESGAVVGCAVLGVAFVLEGVSLEAGRPAP